MNRLHEVCLIATLVLLVGSLAPVLAQDKAPEMSPEQKAMMDAWMKASTPGDHHKHLAGFVGSWKTSNKAYMDPSAPPIESTGSCEYTMGLGERFLVQTCSGEAWGQPFHGWGAVGYDNVLKKHTALWMDNMGTSMISGSGSCSENGKVLKMSGEFPDPMTGKMKAYRYTVTMPDPNKHILEWYEAGMDGKEMKVMEITYTK